jgi:hypothetical protein
LHFHRLRLHDHTKSVQELAKIHLSEGNHPFKHLTEQELQQRQLIEQYILFKLETYTNKPRLWHLRHSSHVKQRLLDKSHHISNLYSLSNDFVRESINQLFLNVDQHVLQIRRLIQSTTHVSIEQYNPFRKVRKSNNQWHSLQLKRAKEIFPNLHQEELTENEILQKYYRHIIETLTPKPDLDSTNSIAQLREQPFDLNQAYEQAEHQAKDYLTHMLKEYHEHSIPNLELIQEMVNLGKNENLKELKRNFSLGLKRMKVRPTNEEFENATKLLDKVSLLQRTKQAYESGLRNMGDDFMLLRFGKIFGPNALPTTQPSNAQYIYLVHLFIKSISKLMMMMGTSTDHTEQISSTIMTIIFNIFSTEIDPSIIKLTEDALFSPKLNADQWTWLLEKWRDALRTFPMILTKVGAFTRLLRTTIGIGLARIFVFAETMIHTNQILDLTLMNEQLFHALQMGFYFGVAYAIVDCVQDEMQNLKQISLHHLATSTIENNSNDRFLTTAEISDKWLLIMEGLLSGKECNRKELPKTPLTPLLLETFDSLVTLTKSIDVTCLAFNELALLLRSQRVDKKIPKEFYNDEELFLGKMTYLFVLLLAVH